MSRPIKDIRTWRRIDTGRISVMFIENPNHWIGTPESDKNKALAWARRNKGRLLAKTPDAMLFRNAAKDMFSPDGRWAERIGKKGKTFSKPFLRNKQGHVDNYLIPLLGDYRVSEITRRIVDDAVLDVRRADGDAKPLAPATKEKIIYTASIVFDEFVDAGLIRENPLIGITHYYRGPVEPRGVIPRESLSILFPETHEEMMKIWGSSLWVSFFCYLYDTGNRPNEIRATKWEELNVETGFLVVRNAIAAATLAELKGTKTDIIKPAYLSDRTLLELSLWRMASKYNKDSDFIFSNRNGNPVAGNKYINAFHKAKENAGFKNERWTPYWLRHSFGTYHLKNLSIQELMTLMGHASVLTSKIYQHPDNEIIYEQSKGLRDKLYPQTGNGNILSTGG